MSKSGKVIIGCLVAVVALVLGIGLSIGGYFLWQHFNKNDGNVSNDSIASFVVEPSDETSPVDEDPATSVSLASQLESVEWTPVEGAGFSYPSFMTRSERAITDVPATVNTYTWKKVELGYWPLIGTWAVSNDNFPVKGNYLTEDDFVEDVTYKAEEKGIFSGHTDDGRIFYMKKKINRGGEVNHVAVLVVVYPEENQSDVQRFIEMIKEW